MKSIIKGAMAALGKALGKVTQKVHSSRGRPMMRLKAPPASAVQDAPPSYEKHMKDNYTETSYPEAGLRIYTPKPLPVVYARPLHQETPKAPPPPYHDHMKKDKTPQERAFANIKTAQTKRQGAQDAPPSYEKHMAPQKTSQTQQNTKKTPQEEILAGIKKEQTKSQEAPPPSYHDYMATQESAASASSTSTFQPTIPTQTKNKTKSDIIKSICNGSDPKTNEARENVLDKLWNIPVPEVQGEKIGDVIKRLTEESNNSQAINDINTLADNIINQHHERPQGMSVAGHFIDSFDGIIGTVAREVLQRKKDRINVTRDKHKSSINNFLRTHSTPS